MKLAFIGARGVVGKYSGIETYYEEVGSRLVSLGHDVTVYCRSYFTPAIPEYRGIRVRRFPTVRSKHLDTLIHSGIATLDALVRDYDIVQFHALGSSPFAVIPRVAGKKTVVSVRGLDGQRAKWGGGARAYLKFCEWASVRCPTSTGVVSKELRDYYRRTYNSDTTYIPNGVTLKARLGPESLRAFGLSGSDYILYVGRLTPEKDCHLLIEAFAALDTPLKLVFVGGASYADEYVAQLKKHESEKIRFLGFQTGEALEALFSNAYFYVLPSRIEGLSISLLEAMGWGNCVLTSDIPENRELVDGLGFTFRTGDVTDLRRMLEYLIASPDAVAHAGRVSRELIEREYDWDTIALRTEAMFKRVLGLNIESSAGAAQPTR
jgi:glycosyltransferase involved in cell wall biosynthesis